MGDEGVSLAFDSILAEAKQRSLDLVMMSAGSSPPVTHAGPPPPRHRPVPPWSGRSSCPAHVGRALRVCAQVCKIVSYDKYRFEQEKKKKEQKKNVKASVLKEL